MVWELAQVRFDMAAIILSWAVKHENIPNKIWYQNNPKELSYKMISLILIYRA